MDTNDHEKPVQDVENTEKHENADFFEQLDAQEQAIFEALNSENTD